MMKSTKTFSHKELIQAQKIEELMEKIGDWILVDHGTIEHWVSVHTAKLACGLKYKSFRYSNYDKGEGGKICKECFDTLEKGTKKNIQSGNMIKIISTRVIS